MINTLYMKLIIALSQVLILVLIGINSVMALNSSGNLSECLISSNCARVEWSFPNLRNAYKELVGIASSLPRVSEIESSENYWHGIVRSLVFRFPDDLEILRLDSRNLIQVRSASRIGLSDLGVNQRRVDSLYAKLRKKI